MSSSIPAASSFDARWRSVLVAAAATALLGGCMGIGGGGSGAQTTAATQAATPDIRRYIGPNYCPEMRVQPGTEVSRRYAPGGDGDANRIIYQASIGKTARECLYDLQGNLTLRIGISGRVIAGPAGGPATVTLPVRIAVVKYREAVLSTQAVPLSVTIPASLSTVFSEVREVVVPSPGSARDYIIYVGFDDGAPVPVGAGRHVAGALDLEATDIIIDQDGQADLLGNPGN